MATIPLPAAGMAGAASTTTVAAFTLSSSEADVILPPPSASNPIPCLPAALRLDNKDQLMSLLRSHPNSSSTGGSADTTNTTTTSTDFRQLLVFGSPSLRTLLLRQVLNDPHTRTFGGTGTGPSSTNSKKHNWDAARSFPLPAVLRSNIVGTKLLSPEKEATSHNRAGRNPQDAYRHPNRSSSSRYNNKDDDDDVFTTVHGMFQQIDVITYFIRPWDLNQTTAVIKKIQSCGSSGTTTATSTSVAESLLPGGLSAVLGKAAAVAAVVGSSPISPSASASAANTSNTVHHRVVYVPHITALCRQMWADAGGGIALWPNVSITTLQLDIFPLEADVLSMEYDTALYEMCVEGTPSSLIGTTARTLLKVQDIVGTIPRIQALGRVGEDVLMKLLDVTVEEYLLSTANNNDDDDGGVDDGTPHYVTEQTNGGHSPSSSQVACMMIFDRRLDMVTPMVTPLTYEGLLDEVVGIDVGFIHVSETILNPTDDDNDNEGNDDDEGNNKDPKSSKNKSNKKKKGGKKNNPFDDDDDDDGDGNDGNTGDGSPLVALGVHAGDTLFAEVRDQHVEKFGSFLQNQAVALKESHTNFTSRGTKKDLNEIHQFVKQIPIFTQSLRSLTNHIHLAEKIKATTEDVAFRERWNTERAMIEGDTCYDILENEYLFAGMNYSPYLVLRLLCLQSLTGGGLKANRFDQFKQHFIHVYGYDFLPVLHDLEYKLGWIKRKDTLFMDSHRSPFQSLRKNLILVHAEVDTVEPDDVSYVSSGYAPLTVRLVQSAMLGWKDKDEVLKDLSLMMNGGVAGGGGGGGGRLLDVHQMYPPQDLPSTLKHKPPPTSSVGGDALGVYAKNYSQTMDGGGGSSGSSKRKPTMIVVYLGGITHMEIAALRFLSKRDTFPYHIIIVTTKVMNGTKLIRQLG